MNVTKDGFKDRQLHIEDYSTEQSHPITHTCSFQETKA